MTYSYSYSAPLTYGPQQNGVYYDGMTYQKPSAAPFAIGGAVIGSGVGAFIGSKKKSDISKNGEVTDTFAKSVYEKYVDKVADAGKESYNGGKDILKKIDNVKTPEELKTLFDANKEAAVDMCTELKQTPDEFLNNVSKDNLKANKKTIKEKLTAGNNTRYQNMKNQIQACWDKDKKKFVKNENVNEELLKILKKSTSGAKNILKGAAIGGAIAGVAGFILGKLFIK